MNARLHFFLASAALLLGACSSSVIIGADDGGTSSRDGGGVQCGANVCGAGEFCCNESCGYCAPEGGTCTEEACTEPVVCNGQVCTEANAACCPDCSAGESFCSGANGICPPLDCPSGCATDADCGSGQQCCSGCNAGDGFCTDGDGPCPDPFCPPTCGDTTCGSGEQCCANSCPGATDFCSPADEMCPIPDCPAPTCDPFQAWAQGECTLALPGVKWNGSYCEYLGSGCECQGPDCGRLYATVEECQSYHGSCPTTAGCTTDADCPGNFFCSDCAHGSCEFCDDCVPGCLPTPCASELEAICFAERPDCGDGAVAIVKDSCWECVDISSCEPLADDDCRVAGCPSGQECQQCWTTWECMAGGSAC
ncbi:MAG: hypothetical protein CMN30_20490 [Sandaracinus sp.]|nr:hypothetical protein [Sandaracinus sp.]|tara:strand:- start:1090 stop:2187 length:1098 start_codon:yes stop_codon:yes gene_type:complete